jgi:DNA polymerase elongation subunit (family B)
MNDGLEEITVHSFKWETDVDPETGNTVIYGWCFYKDSKPCLLRFHEFDIFCYLELPLFLNNSYVRWEGFREKLVYDKLCFLLGDDRPYRYRFEMKEKYYYYKGENKKYPMLLLCFRSTESMKKCKYLVNKAFKVNGLRGNNRKDDITMVATRIWETHIPVERKLLTLRNSKFCQWFKILGIKIKDKDKISVSDDEYIVDWRSLNPIPGEETVSWLTHPGVLSFDLETYSDRHNAMPDSLCSKHVIYLCSVVYQKFLQKETRKKVIILYGDCSETDLAEVIKVKTEIELLEIFKDLIKKFDPEIITGYNILNYDNPYMEDRLKRKLKDWGCLGRLIGVKTEMKHTSWSSSAYKNQDFHILQMNGRISVDMLAAVRRDHKLPLYNLDYVGNHFLGKGKLPVKAKQMFEIYELQECLGDKYDPNIKVPQSFLKHCKKIDKLDVKDGKESEEYKENVKQRWLVEYKQFALDEMKKVVDYCVIDSDLVIDLFDKLNVWIGLVQLSNIMGINPEDIFIKGTGIRMMSQIYDAASKEGIVLDEQDFPIMNIEGGFVFNPIPGKYKLIPVFDFKSLYPTVMIAHNMDHSTLVNPDKMNSVPDEDCHVIEWDDEIEDEEDSDDDEEIKKVKKKKVIHRKYKFVKNKKGIMPKLLVKLIEERSKVRFKQKTVPKGSVEWNVLEQTQLGIKCSSNAFYGACASSFSKLKNPFIAACITAKARESTKNMNKYLEERGHKIIYGDSVTGDTPLLLRLTKKNGEKEIFLRPISSIKKGLQMWIKNNDSEKEYSKNFGDIEVWSDKGFTKIKHVMRHKTLKRIFRITTHTGVVKVTEDHSLLDKNSEEISPKDIKIQDNLLTKELPELPKEGIEIQEAWVWGIFYGDGSCGVYDCMSGEKSTWAINNLNLDFLNKAKEILKKKYNNLDFKILDTVNSSGVYKLVPKGNGVKKLVEEWRELFYDKETKYKKIPDILWKSSEKSRINFFNGYYAADGDKDICGYKRFDNKGQIGSAGLFYLSRSLGYKVSCNTRKDKLDIYRLTLTKNKQRKEPGVVKKIEDLGFIDDYVYDLETENHHFSAGVGELVVHNTDSTMPDVGITDPKKAIEIGNKFAEELSDQYLKPMQVEFEDTYHTMLCIKKKMYICILLDKHGEPVYDPAAWKIRGVTLARRDNCKFQRDFYKDVACKVLHDEKFIDVFNFIIDKCVQLVTHSVDWEELVMIKGLGDNYKNVNYMMNIFAEEMQKSGNPLVAGDRIPYLVVKTHGIDETEKQKVGYKMRTIDLYTERSESETPEHIDYLHYLEKTIRNGIEKQLFQVGFQKELKELEEKYAEMDQERFFKALEKEITNKVKGLEEIKKQGYRNMISKLFKENGGDNIKVIEKLLEDENLKKIVKPLYNFHIKRRKGRGRRLSSRIDKEPITMFVRIARAKEEVMRSIRERKEKKKPKRVILKILPSNNKIQ